MREFLMFTRQKSQRRKRLLMLFEIFFPGSQNRKKVKLSDGTEKFCFTFHFSDGGRLEAKKKKKSQKFNKAEHESNFVCTKIIINILCCKFDLTAKIFKFRNENITKLLFAKTRPQKEERELFSPKVQGS
jgi:hypothetical protein